MNVHMSEAVQMLNGCQWWCVVAKWGARITIDMLPVAMRAVARSELVLQDSMRSARGKRTSLVHFGLKRKSTKL